MTRGVRSAVPFPDLRLRLRWGKGMHEACTDVSKVDLSSQRRQAMAPHAWLSGCFVFETVSLWSSGWPGTRSIDHSGLELIMIPPDSCLSSVNLLLIRKKSAKKWEPFQGCVVPQWKLLTSKHQGSGLGCPWALCRAETQAQEEPPCWALGGSHSCSCVTCVA